MRYKKNIELDGGAGSVAIDLEIRFGKLEKRDSEFLLALFDLIDDYEKKSSPDKVNYGYFEQIAP